MKRHPVLAATAVLVFLGGLTFGINYNDYSQRAERRQEFCEHDLRQWDVLHGLIHESEPLLTYAQADRFYKVLGPTPEC